MGPFPTAHEFSSHVHLAEIWRSKFSELERLLSRSSNVRGQGHLQLTTYGFLILPHSNYGSICYRYDVIEKAPRSKCPSYGYRYRCTIIVWPWVTSFKVINVKGQGHVQLPTYGFLIVPHSNYGSICYHYDVMQKAPRRKCLGYRYHNNHLCSLLLVDNNFLLLLVNEGKAARHHTYFGCVVVYRLSIRAS